jgi:hypothetical protein
LQEKASHYNVYDWVLERKKQERMIKKICYYPPSLLKKHHGRKASKNHHNHLGTTGKDPNYEIYSLYQ